MRISDWSSDVCSSDLVNMSDSRSHTFEDAERWARLTDKQRACLDLLIERQTSKQIARQLGIAKPTVDLRLTKARDILGPANRDETAIVYARLKQTYDRITCVQIDLPPPPTLMPSHFPKSEERRVGKECGSKCRSLFAPY